MLFSPVLTILAFLVAIASHKNTMNEALYAISHSSYFPSPKYLTISYGSTIASALNKTPGAIILIAAFIALNIICACSSFLLIVPIFFHKNGTASNLSISIPKFAIPEIISIMSTNTSGFV